mmetsp:Transcript_23525/g.20430  ORF Transcript_23525/g.20430 Transcript_23525/m.20430 type:complete len:241 (+) Transcript_23525:41-763(+)
MIIDYITKLFAFFWSVLARFCCCFNLPATIYDSFFTKPISRYTYYSLYDRIEKDLPKIKRILDVGTGTGVALGSIIDKIPRATHITGIDINKDYIKHAKKLFSAYENVTVRHQDFYDLESSSEKYDMIVLGSSFMLMPDPKKALEIVKSLLAENGKVYFLMTLYNEKKPLAEKVKPLLKYFTTIDFGKATYENEFIELLKASNLDITFNERISSTFLFRFFRIFIIETVLQKNKKEGVTI